MFLVEKVGGIVEFIEKEGSEKFIRYCVVIKCFFKGWGVEFSIYNVEIRNFKIKKS